MEGLHLRIVGPPLEDHEADILREYGISMDQVLDFSDVSDAEIATLYANALTLIQMSKYEGFCWPILEANTFGVVAICADETVLRETGEGNVFLPAGLVDVDWLEVAHLIVAEDRRSGLALRSRNFSETAFDRELSSLHESTL
jgi:glycosyltransferase involved in cell wall biosynthesis